MATNFITSHGMIWGEISDTGVTRSYGHDALGSVTETFVNGALENTYRYTPYGSLLAKTGTAPDPSFLWNGGSGYRATGLVNSDFYVRRRHFSRNTAQWTTVDPVWPSEPPFNYAGSNTTTRVDPSGLWPSQCCGSKRTVSQNFHNSGGFTAGFAWGKTDIYSTVYWQVQSSSEDQGLGGVTIKWEEKMNTLPFKYPLGHENRWIDATHIGPTSFPTLASDQATCLKNGCPKTPCHGNSSDTDNPIYPYNSASPLVRCLCFRLTVYSKCDSSATAYLWSQTVSYQFLTQGIKLPLVHAPSDLVTDALYCSQPDGVPCPQTPR